MTTSGESLKIARPQASDLDLTGPVQPYKASGGGRPNPLQRRVSWVESSFVVPIIDASHPSNVEEILSQQQPQAAAKALENEVTPFRPRSVDAAGSKTPGAANMSSGNTSKSAAGVSGAVEVATAEGDPEGRQQIPARRQVDPGPSKVGLFGARL